MLKIKQLKRLKKGPFLAAHSSWAKTKKVGGLIQAESLQNM
jgi:hypothetical protein